MTDILLSGVTATGTVGIPSAPPASSAAAPARSVGETAPDRNQGTAAPSVDFPGSRAAVAAELANNGKVKSAVADANQALAAIGTQLVFVFDDQAHHMAVKLLDVQTQKVVQKIAPTAMPATASALAGKSSSGALVDTKA